MFTPKGVIFLALVFTLLSLSCSGPDSDLPLLTAEMPLHLEEHIDDASIEASAVPEDFAVPVEWNFSEPQPDWKPVIPLNQAMKPLKLTRTEDSLRLSLGEEHGIPGRNIARGFIYIDLPDYRLADWASILVRARTSDEIENFGVSFNLRENSDSRFYPMYLAQPQSQDAPLISDGLVHTYAFEADRLWTYPSTGTRLAGSRDWEHPWKQLIIRLAAAEPVSLDLLSVTIIPTEAAYSNAVAGVRTEIQSKALRRTLYTHTPGQLEYCVRVPEAGRLDVGLGVLRDDVPVSFRITAGSAGDVTKILLEETYGDQHRWAQRSVDLSHLAGRTITLTLEAESRRAGTVALWAAPTLTGTRATDKPNVIFYIIDGGSPDHMSVYGYNRRTTPYLERLAAEGALFENVYSNSTWTGASTPSFMTSLHNSTMGGYPSRGDLMLPRQEMTMAYHMHRAGYQTAVFTDNITAGTETGLDRDGVDVLRDIYPRVEPSSPRPEEIHTDYWGWREAYPAEPYWVHFQRFASHWPFESFSAGLYVSPELRERNTEWNRKLSEAGGGVAARLSESETLAKAGVDPDMLFYARRGLYDEGMAQQDYTLGRLVERLKVTGEWEHTLLIVAADHGSAGVGLRDQTSNGYDPMFRRQVTRVPLLIFWPGYITGGQRFSQTVSMIDVLPTILDLIGLPKPEVMQGQSLAPLLLGKEGWKPRPVILDEFWNLRETGELRGVIEVVDGRWGASLAINPNPDEKPGPQRTVPLLLYDLWDDPFTQHSLHEERPDLVEKYTKFLQEQFEANQTLSKFFTPSGRIALTPEQLEALRSLGYID